LEASIMSTNPEFPANFVAGIVAHINQDHRDEMLTLAHGLAGQDWARETQLLHVDKHGLDLALSAEGRTETLRLSFEPPLEKTTQFRPTIIALIGRAQQQLLAGQRKD
jgi:putative heme iron utilization protein